MDIKGFCSKPLQQHYIMSYGSSMMVELDLNGQHKTMVDKNQSRGIVIHACAMLMQPLHYYVICKLMINLCDHLSKTRAHLDYPGHHNEIASLVARVP